MVFMVQQASHTVTIRVTIRETESSNKEKVKRFLERWVDHEEEIQSGIR